MLNMFDKLVEEKIQEAMRNGDFNNLSTQGKPINLDYWASLPEDIRAGYMLLRNEGIIPEEVQFLKEIGDLREQLAGCVNQDEKTAIRKKIEAVKLKYNLNMELSKRKRNLIIKTTLFRSFKTTSSIH